MLLKFTYGIDKAIDSLYRYSPDGAARMSELLMEEGESHLQKIVDSGKRVSIKSYDWSYNKYYDVAKEFKITTTNLNPKDTVSGLPYFCKGLIEIFSWISIEMLCGIYEDSEELLENVDVMIQKLSEHLDLFVSMLNITTDYLEAFSAHFNDEMKANLIDIDTTTVILGWVRSNGNILYMFDGYDHDVVNNGNE